jgi:hypothetical protein
MALTRARGGWRRVNAVLAAALSCLAAAAHGQAIIIPDFREAPSVTLTPGEPCDRCGVIRLIREVQLGDAAPPSQTFQSDPYKQGIGSTVIVGALVALPLGGGGADKPFVGGVGTPEMRKRFGETTYEVVIRLDNGGYVTMQRGDGASFRVGDRVRVQGIELELLAP